MNFAALPEATSRNCTDTFLLSLLSSYKRYISPFLPPACRFYPSCSQYASQAIARYGASKGAWIALLRLTRCHPFCRGGYDPLH